MSIQRENVLRGPGAVSLGSVQMFDREQIKADLNIETFDVPVSAYGNVDTRRKDVTGTVAFRPCGELTAGILAALYPHGTPSIGASLFGAVDVPCHIHSLAGTKVTFEAAALTGMPNLKLSTTDTAFSSEAQITALIKNATERSANNSFYTVATQAFSGAFNVANVKGGVYTGTWNSVSFKTAEGWDVEFEMATEPQYCDGVGTYDIMLTGVTVRAKCRPIGITESALLGYLKVQGTGADLGASMRSGQDLTITATGGLTVVLKDAAMVQGPMEWGNTSLRIGEVGFVAHRAISGGVPGALFTVALAA